MAAIAPLFMTATATSNNASDVAADNTALEPLPLPVLRLERLRFGCEALDPIRLPSYSGSAWRGLLGQSLRHSVCVTRAPTCEGCLLRQQCAYSTFFESPAPPAQATQRYRVLPHPFVLEPPAPGQREHAPGERLSLGLTLIGPAAELLPYLIHSPAARRRARPWARARALSPARGAARDPPRQRRLAAGVRDPRRPPERLPQ